MTESPDAPRATDGGSPPARVSDPASVPGGGAILRDAFILQVKLLLEGLKDILLGPVALVAALIDLVRGAARGQRPALYEVMRAGRRFERWVNLYGTLEAREGDPDRRDLPVPETQTGMDAYLRKIEQAMREEGSRGELTQAARQSIDRWLDRLEGLRRR